MHRRLDVACACVQCKLAAAALVDWWKKRKGDSSELIEKHETISVLFSLRRVPGKGSNKPKLMCVCRLVYGAGATLASVCMACPQSASALVALWRRHRARFVLDRQGTRRDTAAHVLHVTVGVVVQDPAKPIKERLAANPIPGFSKVISLTKLKQKFGQYKEKRELCASYDAFYGDERILPSLSKALGKVRPN